jgi:cell division protease FtsH
LQVNAAEVGDEPLGEFFHVASLLIPLYAARAWEVAEHGPQAASLATAAPIADCFQIAYYCVRNSLLHPR